MSSAGGGKQGKHRHWAPRDLLVAALCRDLVNEGVDEALIPEACRMARQVPSWADQVLVISERATVIPWESWDWVRKELSGAGFVRTVDLGCRARAFR